MDYGLLIRQAWQATWRYRFLWIIGFLAGSNGSYACTPQWSFGSGDMPGFDGLGPDFPRQAGEVIAIFQDYLGVIIGLFLMAAAIGITLLLLSFVAQGAMARATADLALGAEPSLAGAWSIGRRFFWRYVGLWTLVALAFLMFGLLFVAAVVPWLVIADAGSPAWLAPLGILAAVGLIALTVLVLWLVSEMVGLRRLRWLWIALALVTVFPAAIAWAVFLIAVTVVLLYTQRAIALEDLGPVAAIRSGWALLRSRIGDSALVWVIGLGLGIGAGIAIGLPVAALTALLVAIGFGIWAVAGETGVILYGGFALLAVIALVVVLVAITNTFFWNYWTIAYLRLREPRGPTTAEAALAA